MSVGLLLITHNDIGSALLHTAARMLGGCPLDAKALAVTEDCEPGDLRAQAQAMAEQIDSGDGVLVLTDLFGSTPSNIANALQSGGRRCVLAGVNLPMIVRALNYPALPARHRRKGPERRPGWNFALYRPERGPREVIRKEVTIVNKLGLHARAAAKLVGCAGAFASQVQLERNGQRVNGKSIMGVMMLAAAKGSSVALLVDGDDEQAACAALEELIASRFGENE